MNKFNILAGLVGILTVFTGYLFFSNQVDNVISVGTELPDAPALFETSLAAPITATADSFTLTANSVRGGGSLSGYNCFTIDEGSAQAEFVCGTASSTSVTGVTRGISPSDGTSAVSALQFAHRRGASVKITDFPIIQILRNQNNGEATFENALRYAGSVVPSGADDLADVGYVLSVVNGGTVTFDALVVAGRAGETVATGTLVYFNGADQEWYKVDADTFSTFQDTAIGLTQGAGINAGNIGGGGILLQGRDDTQSTLIPGATYYASTTAGFISTATTSQAVGKADSSGVLYFDPNIIDSYNVYDPAFGSGIDGSVVISGTTTLTRDMFYENLTITGTLVPNGYKIFVKNLLTGTGTISASGTPGTAGGTGATPGTGGGSITGFFRNSAGGAGTNGSVNVDCFNSASSLVTSTGVAFLSSVTNLGGAGGASTGINGCSSNGNIAAGASTPISFATSTNYTESYNTVVTFNHISLSTSTKLVYSSVGGTGGTGGATKCVSTCNGSTFDSGAGGGGGASGQIVFIAARFFGGSFSINANGGNGGNGGNSTAAEEGDTSGGGGGGGGGGNGGIFIKLFQFDTYTGSVNITGGTGGTGGTGSTGGGTSGSNGVTGSNGYILSLNIANLLR